MRDEMFRDFAKFGKTPTWEQLRQWCFVSAGYWQFEGKVDPSPRWMSPPPTVDEKAVDIWCLKLLAAPKASHDPPGDEKPWILARLVFGAAFCAAVAKSGGAPLGDVHEALKIVLIGEWRNRGEFWK
jgi:hypothetical protein